MIQVNLNKSPYPQIFHAKSKRPAPCTATITCASSLGFKGGFAPSLALAFHVFIAVQSDPIT